MAKEAAEIEAILARLRENVRSGGGQSGASVPRSRGARADVERLWSVTAEPHLAPGRGPLGWPKHVVKVLLYRAMRWYVEPFAGMQRAHNVAALRLADELARRLTEIEERLTRTERRARPAASGGVSTGPSSPLPPPSPLPDYFAFEARMRGPVDVIRERQQPYVEDFRQAAPVLDVGCGRGEFLMLLTESGVEARGIDLDADMVAYCRGEGLDVEQADAISYLERLPDASLGGVFCAHVLEHLPNEILVRLLDLAAAKVRPGGLFVAETPNPRTLVALSTFFADLSHVRPLHPETLIMLAQQVGFGRADVRYLNEPPPEGRLSRLPRPGRATLGPKDEVVDENFERLNEIVFGPQDYALVAWR